MILSVQNVSYRHILSDVSVEFHGGQFIGLIGPNGAGKSTLLRMISGIWRQDQGQVTLDGLPVHAWRPRERARQLAYLPQQLPDDVPYTVAQFVEMGRYAHHRAIGDGAVQHGHHIAEALSRMNLNHLKDVPLSELSGGERQRAAIARCMAQASPVWLLDEPISNLDLYYQLDILKHLRTLADEGHLVVLAIHHLELAAQFCHQLALLNDGKVVSMGEPGAVLTPAVMTDVFRLQVATYPDPYTGALRFSYR